jgi:hypothetical protein
MAVETRATTTGSGALRRFLHRRRRTQEPFLLNRVLDRMQGTTGSSTCFEGGKRRARFAKDVEF